MKGKALIAGGLLLLAAALVLLVRNITQAQQADLAAQAALTGLKEVMETLPPPATVSETEEKVLPDTDTELRILKYEYNEYVGILNIPALQLTLPVINSLTYDQLEIAPCRYMGTPYKDTLIIGAHNYPKHFGQLNKLAKGDEVSFADFNGNTHYYVVDRTEQLAGTAIEEMESGDWDMTLFTCTVGGYARIAVRCVRAGAE